MKTVKFFGREVPLRFFFFLGLGFILGFYLFFPTKFQGEFSKFQEGIAAFSIFFGGIYLVVYLLIFGLFEFFKKFLMKIKRIFKKTKVKSKTPHDEMIREIYIVEDILMYYLGGFFGLVLFAVFGAVALAGFGLFHLIKFLLGLSLIKFFGVLSAIIVLASYPPYIIRIWQRKIIPNLSSWIIFVLVSVSICLSSYSSSGEGVNSWVTLGPLVGCLAIVIVAFLRSKEKSLTRFDIICLILGIISIVFWFFTKQSRNMVQFALYIGIFADFMGLLPSIKFLSKYPEKDRPFLWIIFSFGYFLSMFAITEHTLANWILPIFMTLAPALVWVHLVKYRVKNKIPLKEWI